MRHDGRGNGKLIGVALCALLLALGFSAEAQQVKKIPRIGWLELGSPSTTAHLREAFRQGLHELGYIEGQNIVVEWRWADGREDRLSDLAAELVQLKVNVIVTTGTPPIQAVQQATRTIPIVVAAAGDIVGMGFAASLARPGGNITGLTLLSPELSGKRLELLKEIVPGLSRVAVLYNSSNQVSAPQLAETQVAARSLGVQLQSLGVRDANEFDSAFAAMARERTGALIVLSDVMFFNQHRRIVSLATKGRLPAVFWRSEFTEAGGLLTYGPNVSDMYRRAATYVDKILKGAKPADLPVEQPIKFEFIINLKAAKQIGLTIPPNVLARADKVFK
jgi:ABC-type uncharacterized transport system substrate-binding protein